MHVLYVDIVREAPEFWSEDAMPDDEVQLLQVGHGSVLQQGVAASGAVIVLQLPGHLLCDLGLLLQCQRHYLLPSGLLDGVALVAWSLLLL